MKHHLTAAIAAIALTFSGAAAANELSGVVSVNIGVAALDSSDSQCDEDKYFTFGGDARVSNQKWIFELQGQSIGSTDNTDDDEGSISFMAAGHYLWEPSDELVWGVFGGVQHTTFQDEDDTAYHAFVGAEAARHWDRATVYGQVGYTYAFAEETDNTWESGPFVRAGFRYFPDENRKIEVEAGTGYGDHDSDGSSDKTNNYAWGVEYEQQIGQGPFSFAVSYRGYYTEEGDNFDTANDATDHVFGLSFRMALGNTGSVQERHQRGADRFRAPNHHRAYAYPDQL